MVEIDKVGVKKRNFLKNATVAGAATVTGAVGLTSLRHASAKEIEELIPTIPDALGETLLDGGQRSLPNYEVVPLSVESMRTVAIQMNTMTVDPNNPKERIKKNLMHACYLIDHVAFRSAMMGPKLIVFPEFFIPGSYLKLWTRKQYLNGICITLPGEETDQLGEKAKQYKCYIAGDANTIDDEWPNQFFHSNFLIGPNGKVIHQHWKAFGPGGFEWAASVHDVLDEFVKRYGWDAVWPVARTDIGNIATMTCSETMYPETYRAFALKGAEIFCIHFVGPGPIGERNMWLVQRAGCLTNNAYGILANAGLQYAMPGLEPEWVHDGVPRPTYVMGGGYSCIINPRGKIMEQFMSFNEGVVGAQIPIAAHRKNRSIPVVRNEIYVEQYKTPSKYPPNIYLDYQPVDAKDAIRYNQEKAQW